MNLFRIIAIIVLVWLILRVRRFIYDIRVTSGKSKDDQKKKNWIRNIDIQDADYEDVE